MRPPDRGLHRSGSGLRRSDQRRRGRRARTIPAKLPGQPPDPAPFVAARARDDVLEREWLGAAWTDKPRVFWIGEAGVAGFFSYESAIRRLVLNRFRPPSRCRRS